MKERRHRDEGAVMVFVAIMMIVLIAIGALVIDIGRLYVEKRELQNGADAAALAVAWDCAGGDCGTPLVTAQGFAVANAEDNAADVTRVCGQGAPELDTNCDPVPARAGDAAGWVRVETQTRTADGSEDGSDEIGFFLAPVINAVADGTVKAEAVAAWGALQGGPMVPFVFSICEYVALGGSFSGGSGSFPSGIRYIVYHGSNRDDRDVQGCTSSPSGQDLPGGFGRTQSVGCIADLLKDQWAQVDTGADLKKNCDVASWRGQEIVLALYDQVRGTGSNGEYHIVGFVGFRLLGDRLAGQSSTYSTAQCPRLNPASIRYMCGEFTKISTNIGDFGGGNNYGASVVKLIG